MSAVSVAQIGVCWQKSADSTPGTFCRQSTALAKPAAPFVIDSTRHWVAEDVRSVSVLGQDGAVDWEMTDAGLRITPPAELSGEFVWVLKVRCDSELKRSQQF